MEAAQSAEELDNITTEYMLKLATDFQHQSVEDTRRALERCRSRLKDWPAARRLLSAETLCPHCSAPWRYGQYRAELRPRPVATKPLRRLLNKHRLGRPLGRLQTRLLHRFLAASDCVVLECKLCQRSTRLPIRSRSARPPEGADQSAPESAETTPVSSGRRRSSKGRDRTAGLLIPVSMRKARTPSCPLVAGRAGSSGPRTPVTPVAVRTPVMSETTRTQDPLVLAGAGSASESAGSGELPGAGTSPAPGETRRTGKTRGVGEDSGTANPPEAGEITGTGEASEADGVLVIESTSAAGRTRRTIEASAINILLEGGAPGNQTGTPDGEPKPIPLKNTNRRLPLPPARLGRERGRAGTATRSSPAIPATAATPTTPASSREKQRRLHKLMAQAAKSSSTTGLLAFLSDV